MKIYAIKDDTYEKGKELAYLFFYEKINEWYIELADEVDRWELPLILDHFADEGRIVPYYWAGKWVQQRVIPADRQNIASILVEAGLESYDEFKLFELDYEYVVNHSVRLPITANALYAFSENEVISTTEAMNLLNCSRQNIDDLVKRGRLKPAEIEGKTRMFFRKDVLNL